MKSNILVLGVKGYNFEKDGKQFSGAKMTYVSQLTNEEDTFGVLPLQQNVDLSFAKSLKSNIPGIFEAEYGIISGKNNQPTLTIVNLIPVKSIDIVKQINS